MNTAINLSEHLRYTNPNDQSFCTKRPAGR